LGDVKVIMVFGLLKQNLRHCLKLESQSGRTTHYLRGANKLVVAPVPSQAVKEESPSCQWPDGNVELEYYWSRTGRMGR
jgi:hypothetical protein